MFGIVYYTKYILYYIVWGYSFLNDLIIYTVKSFGNMKTLSLGRKYTSGGMHGTDLLVLVYK